MMEKMYPFLTWKNAIMSSKQHTVVAKKSLCSVAVRLGPHEGANEKRDNSHHQHKKQQNLNARLERRSHLQTMFKYSWLRKTTILAPFCLQRDGGIYIIDFFFRGEGEREGEEDA